MDKRIIEIAKEYKNKIDELVGVYNGLDDYDKLEILSDYLDDNSMERPYSMDCFDEFMDGQRPLDIVHRVVSDFCVFDELFWFDGYGNIHSGNTTDALREFDDIDSDWLNENCGRYACFNDYMDELDAIINKYYDVADELGVDVPAIEDFNDEQDKDNI